MKTHRYTAAFFTNRLKHLHPAYYNPILWLSLVYIYWKPGLSYNGNLYLWCTFIKMWPAFDFQMLDKTTHLNIKVPLQLGDMSKGTVFWSAKMKAIMKLLFFMNNVSYMFILIIKIDVWDIFINENSINR